MNLIALLRMRQSDFQKGRQEMNKKQKKMMTRIIIAAVLLVVLHFIPITGIPRFICYLAIYLEIGYDILKKLSKESKTVRCLTKTS